MVVLFGYILYYTKLNMFASINEVLQTVLHGGTVTADLLTETSLDLDRTNYLILAGMVVFATITGVIAAHITLVPTRNELSLRKKFITAVAHELRTPLAVLRTSNEVAMYDAENNPVFKQALEDNIEEIKHISNILNNLIIFSRVGAEESLSFEPADVSDALQGVIKKLNTFASQHKVEIKYEKTETPLIYANKTALDQIFYNLVKNAIIYSKKTGGTLTVSTMSNSTYLAVIFKDTGIGMSRNNIQHIFEPFYRINPDDSQSSSGTGLGLSLVLEIMKLHKGIINVESEEGEGTTFTLQFPLHTAALKQEPIPQSSNSVSFSFEEKRS